MLGGVVEVEEKVVGGRDVNIFEGEELGGESEGKDGEGDVMGEDVSELSFSALSEVKLME